MSLPGESITEIPAEEAVAEPVLDGADDGNEYDEGTQEGAADDTDGTDTVEPADPYADFGGREAIEKAVQLQKMTQSQDGVMRMMFAAAQSLGIPLSQVEQLFQADRDSVGSETPQYADDDLITYGQVREMLQREVLQPWQQTEAERAETTARQIVTSTRGELGIEDDNTWNAVLQLGDRYLGDDISPANVAKAIKQGHADFVNLVKTNAKAYVEKKAAVKQTVPKAPAGGSMPAAAPEAEPKTVEEAIARARKRLLGG